MKERPILFSGPMVRAILKNHKTMTRRVVKPQPGQLEDGRPLWIGCNNDCPYGQPGDRLWVRETWYDDGVAVAPTCLGYAADGDIPHGQVYRVRPSIFMPRWASRILLEIISVRVERLHDISADDAYSEGAQEWAAENSEKLLGHGNKFRNIVEAFRALWDSINEKRGYSWDSNPWVWVVEFKRVEA